MSPCTSKHHITSHHITSHHITSHHTAELIWSLACCLSQVGNVPNPLRGGSIKDINPNAKITEQEPSLTALLGGEGSFGGATNGRGTPSILEIPLPSDPCQKPTTTAAIPAAGVTAVKTSKSQQLQAWLCKVKQDRQAKLKEWVHEKGVSEMVQRAYKAGASFTDEPKCFNCGNICARSGRFLDTDLCWGFSKSEIVGVTACGCLSYAGYKRGAAALSKWITPKDLGVA